MIHLFINALAASAGGGLTYVRNVIPHLAMRPDVRATILLSAVLREEVQNFGNIRYLQYEDSTSRAQRFWREQRKLPELIQRSGADVLISSGNFALRKSPIPQILLSRNSLYTSPDFGRDLLERRRYSMWMDTKTKSILAKRSLQWADCTVAPSRAFAKELESWTGRNVLAIHHGFDKGAFFDDRIRLAPEVQQSLLANTGALRLLFVSHYNYYRNFETLLRAIPLIREKIAPRPLTLFLTCDLRAGSNTGGYDPRSAATLMRRLGITECVVQLGGIPYKALHHVYKAADIYVTPAYAESFAHPLVEAMACGVPIVASDLSVHREICGDAAVYFGRFSERELAQGVSELVASPGFCQQLKERGRRRSESFSWEQHTAEIVGLAQGLVTRTKAQAA
jgi:glycosyltransferase involved in cell wall biosynthesis